MADVATLTRQAVLNPLVLHFGDFHHQIVSNSVNITGSMSRLGNCWDNAMAKSFFGSLKQEQIHWQQYQTRHAAQQDVLQLFPCFITASDCFHTWGAKARINMKWEQEC